MGKAVPALVMIISLALGVGLERLFRQVDFDTGTTPFATRSPANTPGKEDPAKVSPRPAPAAPPHPEDSLATSVAAVQNNRPLLILRYLEDPASRGARVRELADALVELNFMTIPRNAAGDAMLALWAEHDARDALRYASSLTKRFARGRNDHTVYSHAEWQFLEHFYSLWLQLDPPGATATLDAEVRGELKKQILKAYRSSQRGGGEQSKSTAELSEAAQASARNPTSTEARIELYRQVQEWAKLDPEAAIRFAEHLPPGHLQRSAWRGAIRGALQERPDLVAALSDKLTASNEKASIMLQAAEHWMKLDPEACRSWLATLPPGGDGDVAVLSAAQAIMKDSPLEALALLESRDWQLMGSETVTTQHAYFSTGQSTSGGTGPQRRSALQEILQEVARVDPHRALRAAGDLVLMPSNGDYVANPLQERTALVDAIMTGWLQSDPEALREFLVQVPGAEDLGIVTRFGFSWAGETAEEAAAFASTLEAGGLHDRLVEQIARRGDPEALLALAATMPEHTRFALERGALPRLARENPEVVAERLQQLPRDQANDLLGPVLFGFRDRDGFEAAAAWLTEYPDQRAARFHYGSLARYWIRTDPEGLAGWVDSLPPGPNQDAAIDRIASTLSPARGNADHAAALEWSLRLNSERSRDTRFVSVMRNWHRADPAAALEALDGASIPGELRDRVLGSLQGSPPPSN